MISDELRYKIGQMLIFGFNGYEVSADSEIVQQINKHALGGVILFDYDFRTKSFAKNISNPKQVLELNTSLQNYNTLANKEFSRPNLPLLTSVDYEGGKVDRLKAEYGFPKTVSAAEVATYSDDKVQMQALEMAKTLASAGFNVDFAPVLDVNINPSNPVLGMLARCFSEDPDKVSHYANIYAAEFAKKNIIPVFKHFPGHGSSTADSHLGFVDVTETWQECEIIPYRNLQDIDVAKSMIMTAHVVNKKLDSSGVPATLSYKILTELLREELNFLGVVVTDDMQMQAIADNYKLEESLPLAINAGADMLIFGNQLAESTQDPAEVIEIIIANINANNISVARIEQAFQRIQKIKLGLN